MDLSANGFQNWLIVFSSAVIASLFVADLVDRFLIGPDDAQQPPTRWPALGMLIATAMIFTGLQYAGMRLIPQVDQLMNQVREICSSVMGGRITDEPLSIPRLILVAVLGFYVAGLWDYLVHRYVSHSQLFWFTHEYHHLPSQVFVGMPGIFGRPFVAFPALLTLTSTFATIYAILLLVRNPLWDVSVLLPISIPITVVMVASHSCFLRRFDLVHRIMKWTGLTTPQEHVLHHSAVLKGNYGNFTSVWDRMFGTYLDPTQSENKRTPTGLNYDQDFLGTLTFGKIKMSRKLREQLQVGRYCNLEDLAEVVADESAKDASKSANTLGKLETDPMHQDQQPVSVHERKRRTT